MAYYAAAALIITAYGANEQAEAAREQERSAERSFAEQQKQGRESKKIADIKDQDRKSVV